MTSSPNVPVPRKPLRRRLLNRRTIAALLIAVVAGGGYWGWKTFYGKPNPRELYQIATVEKGDLQDLVTATGTVQPRDYVDVGAQVSGQLKKLHIEVGSVVQAGDLLAEIDPTVLRANFDARRAGLRNQEATMKERESNLALVNLQYTRQKNLMGADATTAEAMQQAEADLRAAKAQIEALKAQIDQTQSTLRADEANLSYAKIYAPMTGTVVSLTARQGQTLNANQSAPTILRVADLSTMTVQTQVSEAEVSKLRMGMEVYFTTLGSQGRRWYGALRKVEPTPTVTNNVVLYNALFDVPNNNNVLMPSMTTQVFFIAASARDVLLVPTSAVTLERQAGNRGRRDEAAPATRQDAAKTPPPSATAPAADRPAGMTREERKALRERRNATPSSESSESAKSADAPPRDRLPVAGSTSGFADQSAVARVRRGKIKVIDAEGNIEERSVELGVTTRVQMQVLSGVKEGEEVIAGLKPPPGPQRARAAGATQQGGLPPGMGGGRAR